MPSEQSSDVKFEIGHVLFIDIVGYSKLLINEQTELVRALNEAVRGTEQVRLSEKDSNLVRLPTGDGMALVFRTTPEAAARSALEVSQALKSHPEVKVRMGIHSGPVNEVTDVNGRANIAGAGINIAQRVMDCGDEGHILLSKRVAEDLENYGEWQPRLHDLGPCEVKHGVIVSVVNLYTETLGNPKIPQKLRRSKWKPVPRLKKSHPLRQILVGSAAFIIVAAVVIWQLLAQARMKAELVKLRQGVIEYPQIEAQVRGARTEQNPAAEQERIYTELGKQLGVNAKVLREKLPQLAAQLKQMPTAGTYERANASYVSKDYRQAESLALQAAADAQKNVPTNNKDLVSALELAGLSAFRAIEYQRAMEHFRQAEKLLDRNEDLDGWARLQHDIADLLVAQGKYGDAEKVFRDVIGARSTRLGPEHPDTLDTRHRLIYALTRQSKYAEAENEARQVLRARQKILGADHLDTIVSRYNLAEPLIEEGKYAEAETLYRDVIRQSERVLGPEHPRTLAARVGLATVLGAEGKNAEAEPLYREIIELDQKVYGPEHPNTLNDRQNLATTLDAEGKHSEAETEYRDVIRIDENLVGAEHPDTLFCRNNLAELLNEEGKFSEAEAECRRAVSAEEKVVGPQNRLTLNTRGNLALALISQGKFPEAEIEYKDVIGRMEQVLGVEHPDTISFAEKFATALVRQNRKPEATKLLGMLQERALKAFGSENSSAKQYTDLVKKLELNK